MHKLGKEDGKSRDESARHEGDSEVLIDSNVTLLLHNRICRSPTQLSPGLQDLGIQSGSGDVERRTECSWPQHRHLEVVRYPCTCTQIITC